MPTSRDMVCSRVRRAGSRQDRVRNSGGPLPYQEEFQTAGLERIQRKAYEVTPSTVKIWYISSSVYSILCLDSYTLRQPVIFIARSA